MTQARTGLLDALEALEAHRDAVIIVGAQAIYLHTGSIEVALAEYTTDADLALDPNLLSSNPLLSRRCMKPVSGRTREATHSGLGFPPMECRST